MPLITIKVQGDTRVRRILSRVPGTFARRERLVRQRELSSLRAAVQEGILKQGLIETGEYYDSIRIIGNSVMTDNPAANRHEFGFVGRDSLGRIYDQAPRAHWRPAIANTKLSYPAALLKELKDDVNKG